MGMLDKLFRRRAQPMPRVAEATPDCLHTSCAAQWETAADIGKMIDSLNTALMGGRMPAKMHATIASACAAQTTPKAMVQAAVYLIGSSSNYQVER